MSEQPAAENGDGGRAQGRATLRDIARGAGVHVSTVSRVLNGQAALGRITATTEERIRQVAAELGYRRNTIARALRTGRTLVIGMVVPDIANLYQAGINRAAEDAFSAHGYSLLLASTDDSLEHAKAQVSAMLSAQTEGLLYGVARRDDPVLDAVIESGTPVVLFNRAAEIAGVSAVLPDDGAGAEQAVRHLLALGHRHVAYVGGPEDVSSTINRRQAIDLALGEEGLTGATLFADRHTEGEGYRVTAALLATHPDTTGLIASNDRLALGAIDAIRAQGRSCPEDVSVVGFNDMPYADRMSPPLTTVRFSPHDIGFRAASLLLEAITDGGRESVVELVAPELVVRGSTAAPRPALTAQSRPR